MEFKWSKIQPTASKIVVYELIPLVNGQPTIVLNDVKRIVRNAHSQANVVIGYVSEISAQPRFKHYEEHKGLDVRSVTLIYQTDNVGDATQMEAALISAFRKHPNNCNVRNEDRRDCESRDTKYYVYLASDKRLDFGIL